MPSRGSDFVGERRSVPSTPVWVPPRAISSWRRGFPFRGELRRYRADRIAGVRPTDETFQPRFLVEF